jgi:hypothetical protein
MHFRRFPGGCQEVSDRMSQNTCLPDRPFRTDLTVMIYPYDIIDRLLEDAVALLLATCVWLRRTGRHLKHGTGDIESRLRNQGDRACTQGLRNPLFVDLGEPTGRTDCDPPIFIFILEGPSFDLRLWAERFGIECQLGQQRVEAETIRLGEDGRVMRRVPHGQQ